jgi:hypothetical protein
VANEGRSPSGSPAERLEQHLLEEAEVGCVACPDVNHGGVLARLVIL